MPFDNRTLFVAFFFVSMSMTLALTAIWRAQPAARGLALMAGGSATTSAGLMLIILRDIAPDLLSVFLGNLLLASGLVLNAEAFRSRCLIAAKWRIEGIIVVSCLILLAYAGPSTLGRIVTMSSALAAVAGLAAADLFLGERGTTRTAATITAIQFAILSAVMTARAILSPISGVDSSLMATTHPIHLLAIALSLILSISFSLTFMWMVYAEVDTELRLANAELKRSNAELDRFAAVVSHDLKAPLNTLTGYLGLVREMMPERVGGRAFDFLASAEDGAWRMNALIDEILTYSRFRHEPDTRGPVDLGAACRVAMKNLHGKIDEGGAIVDAGALPTVTGDQAQFVRLFQNLIDNAIKYRSAEGTCEIRIESNRESRAWKVSVADNGVGIAPAECHRVFEAFQRLNDDDSVEGVGLGLGICRQIVERHGGRIWVESEPGNGSTFFFTVPA